jgi:hypothetical protein
MRQSDVAELAQRALIGSNDFSCRRCSAFLCSLDSVQKHKRYDCYSQLRSRNNGGYCISSAAAGGHGGAQRLQCDLQN